MFTIWNRYKKCYLPFLPSKPPTKERCYYSYKKGELHLNDRETVDFAKITKTIATPYVFFSHVKGQPSMDVLLPLASCFVCPCQLERGPGATHSGRGP
jgi:hypothetical protein